VFEVILLSCLAVFIKVWTLSSVDRASGCVSCWGIRFWPRKGSI